MINCLFLVFSFLNSVMVFFGYLFLFRFNEYLIVILYVFISKGDICFILDGFNVLLFS